ncbi:MAG: peptidoglycan DD-metalloendopeptidase family protein, partial [Phormidesmis sp. CAN_BIN44]|nr:peptidoglycan DD-metalloendopeptidase family protein [Phormidesmis sp. CAN_BIN44]
MLDLIPSLLSQLIAKTVALDTIQPSGTEIAPQQKIVTPVAIATIAPPELAPSATVPLATAQPIAAVTPAPTIQTLKVTAPPTIQRSEAVSQSTPPPVIPRSQAQAQNTPPPMIVNAQPTAQQKPSEDVFEVVVNRESPAPASEEPANPESVAAIANSFPVEATPPTSEKPIQNQQTATTATEPVTKSVSRSRANLTNQSNQLTERRKVLKQRLAEIVAKDNAKRIAQQNESLVTLAYESVSKGQFDQARKLLQPTLPATARANILNTINALEAKSRKVGVTQATEPVRIALNQRQLAQRQQTLLRSVPSLPALPTNRTVNRLNSVPISIQRLPQPLVNQVSATSTASSDSSGLQGADQNYSTTNPTAPGLQAYQGIVPIPNNLTGEQVVYPLPVPAPVTSKFGWRVHPVKGDRRFHAGVDLGAAQGTPILATREGRVAVADRMGGYGLAVVLQHAKGKQDTLYAHMSEMFVR